MSIRATISVHGDVQGVAFRPNIRGMASKMGIRGTIKNCDDDSVLLVCEAQKRDIESLVVKIRNMDAPAYIADMRMAYSKATGEYESFSIIWGDVQEELLSAVTAGVIILEDMSKDIKSITKNSEIIIGQNKTRIEHANDNLKKIDTIIGQNKTRIEHANDNLKKNKAMFVP